MIAEAEIEDLMTVEAVEEMTAEVVEEMTVAAARDVASAFRASSALAALPARAASL